jgi:hypothetical protein
MKVTSMLLTTAVYLSFCGHAFAWGDDAHQVICEIAFRLAQPATQSEIQRLILSDPAAAYPDFSESCVYPDHPFPSKFRIRDLEHYINLPRDSNGLQSDQCPNTDPCVLTAILNDAKILSSKAEPDGKRLVSLKSLGHWVGDIHQPMHVSFKDDKGGNDIKTTGCSPQTKLHAVWDTCLVDYVVRHDVVKAVTELMETITPEKQARWASSSPSVWANETFALAKAPSTLYCVMHDQSCDQPTEKLLTITSEYIETNKPVVREQLQKAGVRLAHILDVAFGN